MASPKNTRKTGSAPTKTVTTRGGGSAPKRPTSGITTLPDTQVGQYNRLVSSLQPAQYRPSRRANTPMNEPYQTRPAKIAKPTVPPTPGNQGTMGPIARTPKIGREVIGPMPKPPSNAGVGMKPRVPPAPKPPVPSK